MVIWLQELNLGINKLRKSDTRDCEIAIVYQETENHPLTHGQQKNIKETPYPNYVNNL